MPDPQVLDTLIGTSRDLYANPSSSHALGMNAAHAIEEARAQVASLLSSAPRAITFTSGATEANGLAIRGAWEASRGYPSPRRTLIVGATEHPSVLESALSLSVYGARVIQAPVNYEGVIDLPALQALMTDDVLLVSVMAANNETGTISPQIGRAHV